MDFSGFSVAQPPEVSRIGRKRKPVDPEFLTAYAQGLSALEGDAVLALADTYDEKRKAQRAITILKNGLVEAGLVSDITTLRGRVWEESEGVFRTGLRIGEARKPKEQTESAPAETSAEPETAPVATEQLSEEQTEQPVSSATY